MKPVVFSVTRTLGYFINSVVLMTLLVACGGGGGGTGGTSGSVSAVTTSPGAILQYILVTPNAPPTLPKGSAQQFVATGYYSDGTAQNLTASAAWISSATTVASINASGLASGVVIGNTNITATAGGVTSIPVKLHVMVATLTSIAITSTNPPSIGVGQTTQYKVTGTYSDGYTQDVTPSVWWASGNTSKVDVNTIYTTTPGLATGVAPGTATIYASLNNASISTSLTVTDAYAVGGKLSLFPAGSSITLTEAVTSGGTTTTDSITLNANGSFYFPVALAPGSTYDVTVSSVTLPAGHHACTVVNGSGIISATMPEPVTSVQIVCGEAVSTIAGGTEGAVNGIGTAASFNSPAGLAVDTAGNVYVADSSNHLIRKITPAGVVSTLAGTAGLGGFANGTGSAATFWQPDGVAVDTAGNVYVADSGNNAIRKITPDGVVSTLAGSSTRMSGFTNGTGAAASFYYPGGVAVDTAGNVYVADSGNNAIRKITPAGVVSTVAGGGISAVGFTNGAVASARFSSPKGVAVDTAGNVYVADTGNHLIRKIAAGQVTTLAGNYNYSFGGFANGTGTAVLFAGIENVAVDSVGNVYATDWNNQLIRKITPAGVTTTLAGIQGVAGSQDGPALSATFSNGYGITVDSTGHVYVSNKNNKIRKFTP